MKRFRNIFFYVVIIGGFSALMYLIVQAGEKSLQSGMDITVPEITTGHWGLFTETFTGNLSHPLAILLLQIATIIVVARLFGLLCKKIKQPAVIGEIFAGIVLGPSFVGMYLPEFSAFLFPAQSLGNLGLLSQVGLILFMFVIGMELDLRVLRKQAHEAVVISHASIIIPFALGLGLAYFIYRSFAPQGVPFVSFGMFLGISMSITAFPVLARIVRERGIQKTRLGTVVLTCAAADDITAWSLLAMVIAIVRAGSFVSALPNVFLAAGYVFILMKIIRPFLKRIGDLHSSHENLSKPVVAGFFLVLVLSAYSTEIIGIHALFGAFMAGAVMPDNLRFKQIFIEKVEDVAVVLLLPLFFVYTGLRTELGLLNDPYLWKVCGLVILVAVTGKFAGSALAAKFTGQDWRDSLTVGALMNTRGLVELVALNIGFDLGVLTPEIFTMLVIMALVTTFMTAPALHLIDRFFRKREVSIELETERLRKYKILISFGKPEMGRTLLKLADYLVKNRDDNSRITALHLTHNSFFSKFRMENFEKESLQPVISESKKLNRELETIFKASENIEGDIIETANNGGYDLLLVGIGHSVFKGSFLGNLLGHTSNFLQAKWLPGTAEWKEQLSGNSPFAGATGEILAKSRIPVGVLIDNNLHKIRRVIMPMAGNEDGFLSEYARKLIANSGARITVIDVDGGAGLDHEIKEAIRAIEQHAPGNIHIQEPGNRDINSISGSDLLLISLGTWNRLTESKSPLLKTLPSVLIIKP